MAALLSKIQYNTFEAGEFVNEEKRTNEEIISLIENFPWARQWENLHVDITNPSVTIENENGQYLKLATYYNNKYILYYLTSPKELYTQSFLTKNEAYPYINSF